MRRATTAIVVGFVALSVMGLTAPARAQTVSDGSLGVQNYVSGFDSPTGMVFVGPGQALVTEKNSGRVRLVSNRTVQKTVLDLPVANNAENGLLNITLSPHFQQDGFVYLYHTVAAADGGTPIRNQVSRYHWDGSSLMLDRKVAYLPTNPGAPHAGGKLAFDKDGRLLVLIGDLNLNQLTQNNPDSKVASRSGAVLKLYTNGAGVTSNPYYDPANIGTTRQSLNDIWAYGIRNGFGLAVDSVSGAVWDTENGPDSYDEINQLRWGFNGGWREIQGPASRSGGSTSDLVKLGPNASYRDPNFSWKAPVAPTDLHFVGSNVLGADYFGDMLVGDVRTGTIYRFSLSQNRKVLILPGGLSDRVADNSTGDLLGEQGSLVWGSDFGVVTDLVEGPDGLYAVSFTQNRILKIAPQGSFGSPDVTPLGGTARSAFGAGRGLVTVVIPEPAPVALLAGLAVLLRRQRGRGPTSTIRQGGSASRNTCP